jgi:glycosyltransferase involved in cell wall biosynthesis
LGLTVVAAISALVCTRNRGASIVDTISSILENTHPDFELVIIDQSANDETEIATRSYLSDKRLKHVKTNTTGKGRALNLGLGETSGSIIAITDDDCTVPSNWLEMFEEIFARNEKVAVAFCNVEKAEHDAAAGFIPAYVRESDKVVRTLIDICVTRGIGAGIAVRRSMMDNLGGFDSVLGPGARFQSADDFDIKYRAVLAGYEVYESAAFGVVHFGFRTWQQGYELSRRDYIGIGAACSKPLKCGRWRFLIVPLFEVFRFCLFPPLWDLLHLRRPRGITRLTSFTNGFIRGLLAPVDTASLRFVEPRQSEH